MALLTEGGEAVFNLSQIMSDAVSSVQTDILTTLGTVVPAIVVVAGAVVAVRFGLKWLKKMGN